VWPLTLLIVHTSQFFANQVNVTKIAAAKSKKVHRTVTASIDNQFQLVSVKSPGFAEIDKPFSLFS
jgi:hypothetical protein